MKTKTTRKKKKKIAAPKRTTPVWGTTRSHLCDRCGKGFTNGHALGGHKKYCGKAKFSHKKNKYITSSTTMAGTGRKHGGEDQQRLQEEEDHRPNFQPHRQPYQYDQLAVLRQTLQQWAKQTVLLEQSEETLILHLEQELMSGARDNDITHLNRIRTLLKEEKKRIAAKLQWGKRRGGGGGGGGSSSSSSSSSSSGSSSSSSGYGGESGNNVLVSSNIATPPVVVEHNDLKGLMLGLKESPPQQQQRPRQYFSTAHPMVHPPVHPMEVQERTLPIVYNRSTSSNDFHCNTSGPFGRLTNSNGGSGRGDGISTRRSSTLLAPLPAPSHPSSLATTMTMMMMSSSGGSPLDEEGNRGSSSSHRKSHEGRHEGRHGGRENLLHDRQLGSLPGVTTFLSPFLEPTQRSTSSDLFWNGGAGLNRKRNQNENNGITDINMGDMNDMNDISGRGCGGLSSPLFWDGSRRSIEEDEDDSGDGGGGDEIVEKGQQREAFVFVSSSSSSHPKVSPIPLLPHALSDNAIVLPLFTNAHEKGHGTVTMVPTAVPAAVLRAASGDAFGNTGSTGSTGNIGNIDNIDNTGAAATTVDIYATPMQGPKDEKNQVTWMSPLKVTDGSSLLLSQAAPSSFVQPQSNHYPYAT